MVENLELDIDDELLIVVIELDDDELLDAEYQEVINDEMVDLDYADMVEVEVDDLDVLLELALVLMIYDMVVIDDEIDEVNEIDERMQRIVDEVVVELDGLGLGEYLDEIELVEQQIFVINAIEVDEYTLELVEIVVIYVIDIVFTDLLLMELSA